MGGSNRGKKKEKKSLRILFEPTKGGVTANRRRNTMVKTGDPQNHHINPKLRDSKNRRKLSKLKPLRFWNREKKGTQLYLAAKVCGGWGEKVPRKKREKRVAGP